jgi:flagellar hook-basal body complex protein FliE
MNVTPFQPDGPGLDETPRIAPLPGLAPLGVPPDAASSSDAAGFGNLVELFAKGSGALEKAAGSERAFAAGSGDLQAMVLDRAQADIVLSAATTAASRTTQSLQTILNMQV